MSESNGLGDEKYAAHPGEQHNEGLSSRLNWLRAGVLGANDGIVSTAGLVVGVAALSSERGPILAAGVAGLVAGAVSMALGEYVSVSTQRDSEKSLLAKEKMELRDDPDAELEELTSIYESKGLSRATALTVAHELTEHDAFAAHVDAELHLDPDNLTSPVQAALSSALSFTLGAALPLIAILAPPATARIPVTFVAVLLALALTGQVSARLGGSRPGPAMWRIVIGGALAMIVTYLIGQLLGVAGV